MWSVSLEQIQWNSTWNAAPAFQFNIFNDSFRFDFQQKTLFFRIILMHFFDKQSKLNRFNMHERREIVRLSTFGIIEKNVIQIRNAPMH